MELRCGAAEVVVAGVRINKENAIFLRALRFFCGKKVLSEEPGFFLCMCG